jgi:NADH dehydrogenase FAD-containing subunit
VDVRVVSASNQFLFNPSLIWLPFGKRSPADITFPLAPTFESQGVDFVHAEATALDLDRRKVTTTGGVYDYDYLVIATGYRNNFEVVPAWGPAATPIRSPLWTMRSRPAGTSASAGCRTAKRCFRCSSRRSTSPP